MEIKDVVGYEGIYSVSEDGEITRISSRRVMTHSRTRDGYFKVCLTRNGEPKNILVHRVVAMAFHDNPFDKPEVNHINANKADNRALNLEWATGAENNYHATKLGLKVGSKSLKGRFGALHPTFKGYVVATCLATGEKKLFEGRRDLENSGFSQSAVSSCISGRLAKHKGHVFKRITCKEAL